MSEQQAPQILPDDVWQRLLLMDEILCGVEARVEAKAQKEAS